MEQKGEELRRKYRYGLIEWKELDAYFKERGRLKQMVNNQQARVAKLEGPGYVPTVDEA